jgi:hypothetical protein
MGRQLSPSQLNRVKLLQALSKGPLALIEIYRLLGVDVGSYYQQKAVKTRLAAMNRDREISFAAGMWRIRDGLRLCPTCRGEVLLQESEEASDGQ